MKRLFPFLMAALLSGSLAAKESSSPVVRPAHDFTFPGTGGKSSLRGLKGQPVVLLIADSPETKEFRKQVGLLKGQYSMFASRQAIFVAAFRQGGGPVLSNIPFVVANNGAAVADAYEVRQRFNIAIIGVDGNVDYQTPKVLPVGRIRDVIENGYGVQSGTRLNGGPSRN